MRTEMKAWVKVLFVLFMTLLWSPGVAYGLVENAVSHGYQTCSTCHVSPTGGGVVNGYGRATAASIMSTWYVEGEENPIPGVSLPEWLAVGGDVRYINVNVKSGQFKFHRKFLMQRDIEIAVSPTPSVTAVASVGLYGEKAKKEMRRHYLKINLGEHFALRAGRFMKGFGVNVSDHTLPTKQRLGMGQGQESYNIEGSFSSKYGEFFLTSVHGEEAELEMSRDDGYTSRSESLSGAAVRGSLFYGSVGQAGISFMDLVNTEQHRQAWGVFVQTKLPIEGTYLWAEYDRVFEDDKTFDVAASKVGWEAIKGVHLYTTADREDQEYTGGLGVQWFPRPHWEFVAEWKRSALNEQYTDTGTLMFHWYH
jgi:hypothetical protein